MAEKRSMFVLATPDYYPELCEITFPYLKKYADKIKADLHRIEKRMFPDYPITYERMQIHELGASSERILCIDPDILIHPDMTDFTTWFPKDRVGNWFFFDIRQHFHVAEDSSFAQDGRYYGIVDCLVVSSELNHELWRPLPGPFSKYEPLIKDKQLLERISEYAISENLARERYPICGAVDNSNRLYHIGCSSDKAVNPPDLALKKLVEWGLR
jgi:hypothetical protein